MVRYRSYSARALGSSSRRHLLLILILFPQRTATLTTPNYDLLDSACRPRLTDSAVASRTRLAATYQELQLPSFGARSGDALPLPGSRRLAPGELQTVTGLPTSAFAPKEREPIQKFGLQVSPLEAAVGLAIGSLLSVSGVLADQVQDSRLASLFSWAALRQLEPYELTILLVSVLFGATTVL